MKHGLSDMIPTYFNIFAQFLPDWNIHVPHQLPTFITPFAHFLCQLHPPTSYENL